MTPEAAALWLSPSGPRAALKGTPDEFALSDPAALESHGAVPPQTWRHSRAFRERGRRPCRFDGIPHVLFRGAIPLDPIKAIRV